jgi:hypothetical protein
MPFVDSEQDLVQRGDNCGRGAATIGGGHVETILDAQRWLNADQEPGPLSIEDRLSVQERGLGGFRSGVETASMTPTYPRMASTK